MSKTIEEKIKAMNDLVNVQGSNGNWDYDEYMFGMFNGMELMLAIAEGRAPNFRSTPNKWLRDVEINNPLPEVVGENNYKEEIYYD